MSRTPAPPELLCRLVAAFPSGHYALDGFLRLLDVVLDDEVESAAVECRATPSLLLSPAFLERWCRTDEHLLMLVMHEVHHVLLGHTRLFRRITEAQNIAFDAVINALLCHMFPAAAYRSFFEQLNEADRVPGCFLRPPPGWPSAPAVPATLPAHVGELVRALYDEAGVGYTEIYRQVETTLIAGGTGVGQGVVLLGDHGPEEGEAGRGLEAARAEALRSALRAAVEKWPQPPDPIRGRSVGGELREAFVGEGRRVPAAVAVLRRAFRALELATPRGTANRARVGLVERPAETAVPDLRDRGAIVRGLLGTPSLLYRTEISQRALRPEPTVVHVYLDVSGSTKPYQADLFAAVRPHIERGRCVIHAFSERVVDVDARGLRAGRVRTSGGTEIACVTEHLIKNDVARALVLTDGYVGRVPRAHRRRLSGVALDVALTPDGCRDDLAGVARRFVELPLKGSRDED